MKYKYYNFIIASLIFLSFSTTSYSLSYEEAKRDAEIFARGKLIEANEISKNTKADSVPGYEENTSQSNYYENSKNLEEDAIQKKNDDDNSNIIKSSYEKKQEFKDEAKKVTITSAHVIDNPSDIINSFESVYQDCEILNNSANSDYDQNKYKITRCDQYENINNSSCYSGNIIKLDERTDYYCSKRKEFYNKTITKNLQPTCQKSGYKFPKTSHISFPNYYYNQDSFTLGYRTPNRMGHNCHGYHYYWRFTIDSLQQVEEFRFIWGVADDRTLIYVNGNLIHNYPNWGCETGRAYYSAPNRDIKPYLKEGDNEIIVRIIVGGRGEGRGEFKVKYKSCSEFKEIWNEQIERDILNFDESKQNEEICTELSPEECISSESFITNEGYKITNQCHSKKIIYNCTQNNFTDYCKTISKIPHCSKFSSECKKTDKNNNCLEFLEKHLCASEDSPYFKQRIKEVNLDDQHSLIFGNYDINKFTKCDNNIKNSHCDNISNKTNEVSCYLGGNNSDCSLYQKNSNCSLIDQKCFDENCHHKEKSYKCLTEQDKDKNNNENSQIICLNQQYCLDKECTEEQELLKGNSLPKVATYLKSLEELGKDSEKSDISNISIFTGKSSKCEKDVFGARNCCKDSGWGESIGIGSCSYDETNLGLQKEKGYCVYVGSYCSEKESLTRVCLKKAQSYCCFSSKLTKIIQNQGRGQMGLNFGSAENPNCRGLSITEMQSINFDQVDFSEYTDGLIMNLEDISISDIENKVVEEIKKGGGGE